jgi:hypothetical protein
LTPGSIAGCQLHHQRQFGNMPIDTQVHRGSSVASSTAVWSRPGYIENVPVFIRIPRQHQTQTHTPTTTSTTTTTNHRQTTHEPVLVPGLPDAAALHGVDLRERHLELRQVRLAPVGQRHRQGVQPRRGLVRGEPPCKRHGPVLLGTGGGIIPPFFFFFFFFVRIETKCIFLEFF